MKYFQRDESKRNGLEAGSGRTIRGCKVLSRRGEIPRRVSCSRDSDDVVDVVGGRLGMFWVKYRRGTGRVIL